MNLGKVIKGLVSKDFGINQIPYIDMNGLFGSGGTSARRNDYVNKGSQLQANIGWVFAANTAISEEASAVKIRLYRKDVNGDREEVLDHELLDLIRRPNSLLKGTKFWNLYYQYMNLTGEAYMLKIYGGKVMKPNDTRIPQALQMLPSHLADLRLGDSFSSSKVMFVGKEFEIGSVIRDINPDPENPYYGRSVIKAAAATIDTEVQMKDWNRSLFGNAGRPSTVIEVPEVMNDDSYKRLKQQMEEAHSGSANAFKQIILEGGAKLAPYMLSSQDLDFLNSRKFSKDEIFAMFRTSPSIVGMTEDVNRANAEAQDYTMAKRVIVPRVRQLVDVLNSEIVEPFDSTLEFDFDNPVPEDKAQLLEEDKAGVDNWLTIDEVREKRGLPELPNGLGKQIYRPMTEAPLSYLSSGLPSSEGEKSQKKGGNFSIEKQLAARDVIEIYDDLDIDFDELGCIMLDTEPLSILDLIPDELKDQMADESDVDYGVVPAEDTPHVTLLFGLLENGNVWKDKVDTVLKGWECDEVTIEKVGFFELKDGIVVVGHVEKSPEILDANGRLSLLPHINTFSEYNPHLSMVYLKKDADAEKWVEILGNAYNGKTVPTKAINYGDDGDSDKSDKSFEEKELARKEMIGEAKAALYTRKARAYENMFLRASRAMFDEQKAEVVKWAKNNFKSYKKDALDEMIDWEKYESDFAKEVSRIYETIIDETGSESIAALAVGSIDFDPFTQRIQNFLRTGSLKASKEINEETKKQIRASLAEGFRNNETVNELAKRIDEVFGYASSERAYNIAQSETTRAQGFADVEAWSQSGMVEAKEWYTARDERVCAFCGDMHGKIISIDDNFFNKGDQYVVPREGKTNAVMNVKYEDIAHQPLHVRCRCVLLPVMRPL